MVSRLSHVVFSTAAMLRLATATFVDSPNDPMPKKWEKSLPMAWDNTEIMLNAMFPDGPGFTKYHNWALDQIIDGNGTVNVCMRWNSDKVLDEETRNDIHTQLVQQYEQWLEWLPGWDNFPFKEVKHNVIAWAVANESQLVGNRDDFHVYTEFKDDNGVPTCDPGCSRHLNSDGDFSKCGRGKENRFQQYFLVDKSWGEHNMGAAGGEGITISEYGWDTVGSQLGNWSILVHEVGHTFGLRDYVNDHSNETSLCSILWLPPNLDEQMVMEPTDQGAHLTKITRFEGWFVRYLWSRFSRLRGWQNDGTTYPPTPECPPGSFE
ncbi:hypothetical protein FVEN_g4533 [Fusarium venenatum]|uniref:Peptidase M43 pregnancy-associated plasma-A domain-containing protein n=1 Tax=Fusarium venenatum TaxID=56646 RepID=A0A2L2TR37_9HYPO|nr:uncharacterized protein FVRRES_02568 [Fusarium venenatum]KAG8357963.1 hypothetical protein FVEN_g4533 [Fusarium venenatum]KAH7004336.1 hypothetical protein EDB82DRAFT_564801 [Fusarium venenatum]CEI66056.1 unnamed protein product [Fusarium venenatum]